ncbi:Ribonuclease H-like superfamily [Sesbania bispinosa]|nr:Ribonuclease H-like superfamily [Sesbania bispinosa]
MGHSLCFSFVVIWKWEGGVIATTTSSPFRCCTSQAEEAFPVPAEPVKKKVSRVPIARRGLGSKGTKIPLQTNHFKVNVTNNDGHFFHYSETYHSDLNGKDFAYDGEKSLFTIGSLPRNKLEFEVVLEDVTSNRNNGNCSPDGNGDNESDRKRMRRPYRAKTFKVEISYAAKIPMQAIANALRGQESENFQEAIRVLDIILRQHAAKQGCLLVRQSFFHNDPNNFADVGGGVLGCRGFHSSFRTTQSGLSLNIDVSTTMVIQPGPVVDFLISNQNVRDPFQLDWAKAKRTLKNLRIKTHPSNQEFKITGLSELPCKEQTFTLKSKGRDGDDNAEEVTVYDYFVNVRKIDLRYSGDLPCINVGKPKRPTYFPIELCELVSLQRYTKALSTLQRASLVEKSRQKTTRADENFALRTSNYGSEPLLRNCGISISNGFTQVEGRVLPAPRLKFGNGEDLNPRNGRWNFGNKKFVRPTKIERWAVVNFSARCDVRGLVRDLTRVADMKGIAIDPPFDVFEENGQFRRAPPMVRVEKMFELIQSKLPGAPQFLLCLIPERKNCEIYEKEDEGIMRHFFPDDLCYGSVLADGFHLLQGALIDFYSSSGKRKPENIIIFRYQRSTTAISVVAPICYAHLAATQLGHFMKFEDKSETSSSHGGLSTAGAVPVPPMPKLQDNVCNSMFFC